MKANSISYIDLFIYRWRIERYPIGCILSHMPPRFLLQVTESFSKMQLRTKPETQSIPLSILNKVCT